jgi:hypothetical protein
MGLDEELFEAARSGDAAKVRELLERGANPNAKHEWGTTPLHLAAMGGRLNVARLLLERGADWEMGFSEFVGLLLVALLAMVLFILAYEYTIWRRRRLVRVIAPASPDTNARDRGFERLAELIEGWRGPALKVEPEVRIISGRGHIVEGRPIDKGEVAMTIESVVRNIESFREWLGKCGQAYADSVLEMLKIHVEGPLKSLEGCFGNAPGLNEIKSEVRAFAAELEYRRGRMLGREDLEKLARAAGIWVAKCRNLHYE